MYAATILQHFQHTEHGGELAEANARSRVGSRQQGRLIDFFMVIAMDSVVQASFKAHGCPVTIACGEYAARWVEAKTLTQLQSFNSELIIAALEIPPHKHYCAVMVEDAVQQAVQYYRQAQ